MPMRLSVNTSINQQSEERIQALLEQQANIQAQIDSIRTSNATPIRHTRSPIYRHRNDSNVPRSHSLSVSPLSRHLSDRGPYHAPMQRTSSGNASQKSAPSMSRTGSNLSGGTPFTNNGPIPIPQFTALGRDTSILDSWTASGEDPANEYTFAQLPGHSQRSSSSRKSGLLENVGEDIANYLSRTGSVELNLALSTTHVQNEHATNQSHLCLPVSPQQFGLHSPVSLYSETLTNDSTLPSEMSRQSSTSNEALIGGFEMIHVNSNSSNFPDIDDNLYALSGLRQSCAEDQTQLLLGAGGVSQGSICPSLEEVGSLFPPTPLHLESMQRSPSNESNSSTSSSRSKLQLQRQIQLANARPLAAKPVSSEVAMSREPSSQSMIRVPSETGGEERLVQAIPKTQYQRPLHPKVWCKKCEDYPEGFRGEHELRRHTDRQHKVVVKKWVCSEPCDGLGGSDHPIPINPLSKCKACSQLKKKYGAYYNAAAHLRRAHFNPKPKGRGKGAKIDGKLAEKRGGKGGGDWPSMNELKRWMREVDEFVVENEQQPEQDDESDGDYMNIDYSEGSMLFPDTSPNSANAHMMGSNFLKGDTHMLDIYDNSQQQQQQQRQSMHMHHSDIDIALDMPHSHANIDHSTMFFDVSNVLLMNDMNDISFSSLPSSFSSDHHQQQQQQQHGLDSAGFEYSYNNM